MTHREFRALFSEFAAPSWAPWAAIEDTIFGVEPSDPDLVHRVTGRAVLPSAPVSEFWAIVGRGGGKSRFAARLALFFACARSYPRVAGEHVYVGVFAPDRKQAAVTFKYIVGLLRSVPALDRLVRNETKDAVELSTGVVVEVITAGVAAPRGRAYALVIVEEAAFLPADDSAEPDVELLRAVRPALARVPGSLLAVISSPYARAGELYRTWSARFGRDDDAHVLVVQSDTLTLNPAFSAREVARAYAEDPVAAEAEYGAQFRADVQALLMREAIAAVVPAGVRERAPDPTRTSHAHLDFATGSGEDAAALAIACADDGGRAVLQAVRRWPPPFDPSAVIAEGAVLLRRFDVATVTIDRFAPGLVADLLRRHAVEARLATQDTSAAFVSLLALVNSRGCELLDDAGLLRELQGLERRALPGGRDRVGHGARGHDDVAAATAFALTAAAHEASEPPLMLIGGSAWGEWQRSHGLNVEPVASEEAPEDVDARPADISASGLAAYLRAGRDRVASALSERFHSPGGKRAQHEVELAQTSRRKPNLLSVVKAVVLGDEHQAQAAAAAYARRVQDEEDQLRERERRDAAARWLAQQVRRHGGAFFPDRD
jgi:hypothetical protein